MYVCVRVCLLLIRNGEKFSFLYDAMCMHMREYTYEHVYISTSVRMRHWYRLFVHANTHMSACIRTYMFIYVCVWELNSFCIKPMITRHVHTYLCMHIHRYIHVSTALVCATHTYVIYTTLSIPDAQIAIATGTQ